ncbi:MAG: hypothetical protein RLZ44_970, partial [Pseudomonadota bacterium]
MAKKKPTGRLTRVAEGGDFLKPNEKQFVDKVTKAGKRVAQPVVGAARRAGAGAKNAAQNVVSNVQQTASRARNAAQTALETATDSARSSAESMQNQMRSGAQGLRDRASNVAQNVQGRVTNAAQNVRNQASNVAQNVQGRVTNAAQNVRNQATDFMDERERLRLRRDTRAGFNNTIDRLNAGRQPRVSPSAQGAEPPRLRNTRLFGSNAPDNVITREEVSRNLNRGPQPSAAGGGSTPPPNNPPPQAARGAESAASNTDEAVRRTAAGDKQSYRQRAGDAVRNLRERAGKLIPRGRAARTGADTAKVANEVAKRGSLAGLRTLGRIGGKFAAVPLGTAGALNTLRDVEGGSESNASVSGQNLTGWSNDNLLGRAGNTLIGMAGGAAQATLDPEGAIASQPFFRQQYVSFDDYDPNVDGRSPEERARTDRIAREGLRTREQPSRPADRAPAQPTGSGFMADNPSGQAREITADQLFDPAARTVSDGLRADNPFGRQQTPAARDYFGEVVNEVEPGTAGENPDGSPIVSDFYGTDSRGTPIFRDGPNAFSDRGYANPNGMSQGTRPDFEGATRAYQDLRTAQEAASMGMATDEWSTIKQVRQLKALTGAGLDDNALYEYVRQGGLRGMDPSSMTRMDAADIIKAADFQRKLAKDNASLSLQERQLASDEANRERQAANDRLRLLQGDRRLQIMSQGTELERQRVALAAQRDIDAALESADANTRENFEQLTANLTSDDEQAWELGMAKAQQMLESGGPDRDLIVNWLASQNMDRGALDSLLSFFVSMPPIESG